MDAIIIVSAKIRFLLPNEGGRITTVQSGYIASVRFGELYSMGAIDFVDCGTVEPGDEREVEISFGNPKYVDEFLKSGQVFDLTEGTRKVGEGRIIAMKKQT